MREFFYLTSLQSNPSPEPRGPGILEALTADVPLTNWRIFRFYYPLALSWLFMSVESPISISLISRLPFADVNTAAFLALMSLALWIESPVIDLLSTSTTLVKDQQSLAVMSRFVLRTMLWCTAVHALVALTPVYDVVAARVLHLPPNGSQSMHTPLALMLPWSACIGWRRYRQGVLIRAGMTRLIGFGTLVRVLTMATSGLATYLTHRLTGAESVAISLICSVAAEALFVHLMSREAIAQLPEQLNFAPLTMRKLVSFHFPLSATTILTLSTMPIVVAALAQSSDAILSLASWQVTMTLLWMHRTIVFALPETVITLYDGRESLAKLRTFCVYIGFFTSGVLGLLWITRGDIAFFRNLLGTEPETTAMAHVAIGLCVLLPFVGALQSYARGALTVHHRTMPRLFAVLVGIVFLLAGLKIGLFAQWSGVAIAAFATTVGLVAEWALLTVANVRSLRSAVEPA